MRDWTETRLGFEITPHGTIRERAELVRWAEERGFEDAWTAEITDPDAFVILTAAALATSTIRLGTAIVPLGSRSVPQLAAATSSLSEVSDGRFALGVGVSSRVIVEDWNGVPYDRPMQRARESITVLRDILDGERTDFDGEQIRTRGFKLRVPPPQRPKILLAALGPKMLELAGEIADGVWMNFIPAPALKQAIAAVRTGAERAGRDTLPEILLGVPCAVTDDDDTARAEMRYALGFYMTAPPYQRALEWYGFDDEVQAARSAWEAKDIDKVRAAISDDMLNAIGAFGPAEYCRERVAEFADAGITTVSISPTQPDVRSTLEAFAR